MDLNEREAELDLADNRGRPCRRCERIIFSVAVLMLCIIGYAVTAVVAWLANL